MIEMQEQMAYAVGHEIEVYIKKECKPFINPFVGKCTGYTQPLDNDPEIASIDIRIPGRSSIYVLDEPDIESIKVLD